MTVYILVMLLSLGGAEQEAIIGVFGSRADCEAAGRFFEKRPRVVKAKAECREEVVRRWVKP